MAPLSTSSDTPSTARTPPKWRWTLSRRRSTELRPRPPAGPHDGKAATADDALRPENDDRDEDHAADDVTIVGGLADYLRQRGQEQRPHHGAEYGAAPPEHREGKHLHGSRDAVLRVARVDKEIEVGFEAAGDACDYCTQSEGEQLVARDVDALAQSRDLILADCRPGLSEPAFGQPPHQENHNHDRNQDDVDTA